MIATDALLEHAEYVVNDEIDQACNRISSIITAEHCKRERFLGELFQQFKAVKAENV
jgi:guanylate kinase